MRRALVGALLFLAGCSTFQPPRVPAAIDVSEAARLLVQLDQRGAARRAVRGRARVGIESPQGSGFARQLLLVERPSRMRIEVLGMLNQPVAVLATDGERYDLYRAGQRGFESGEVRPSVLLEVAGVPLTPQEAVAVLLGHPPAATRSGPLRASRLEDGTVRVDVPGAGGAIGGRSFEFDSEGELRRYFASDASGEVVFEVRYDDFRDVGGVRFAHDIAIEFPSLDTRAEVSFRRVELNPELPAALFRLDIPE